MESIISIPIWDVGIEQFQFTENFVNQCLSMTEGDFGLVIIDNASPYPSTREFLDSVKDPRLKVIRNVRNVGYGSATNQGLKWGLAHGAEYCIVLNNDIYVNFPSWLLDFIYPLRENHKMLLGARVIVDNGMTDLDGKGCIPYAEGWGLAFHKDFIRDVGYFDTAYHNYYEDVDISIRASLAGYPVTQSSAFVWGSNGHIGVAHYLGGVLLHAGGSTGYSQDARDYGFNFNKTTQQSRDYFARKWGLEPKAV